MKKKILIVCLLAGAAITAGAGSLTVLDADFGSLDGWTVTDPDAKIYLWSDSGFGSSLCFKDPTSTTNMIEQNLSANNAITAGDSGEWTVGFEYGWRGNIEGGDAEFTASLIEVATGTTLGSTNVTLLSTGTISDTYTLIGTASFSFNYDTNAVTTGSAVAVRIERTDASDGVDWISTAYIDEVTVDAVGYTAPPPPPPGELVLLNGDFEAGADGYSATNWTDSGSSAYYAAGEGAYSSGRALSLQDGGYSQQEFNIDASVYADEWTLTFDKGFRDDFFTGSATVTVSLLDATDGITVFASGTFDVEGSGSPDTTNIAFTAASMVLDMSAVTSTNGVILKFENTTAGGGAPWERTALVDNLTIDGGAAANGPATILSITPVGGDVLKIVIDAPGVPKHYWPKATENLIAGSWTNAAYSVDGSDPWVATNLSLVTEFESGTNEVIYVQADETAKFYGVGGE